MCGLVEIQLTCGRVHLLSVFFYELLHLAARHCPNHRVLQKRGQIGLYAAIVKGGTLLTQ